MKRLGSGAIVIVGLLAISGTLTVAISMTSVFGAQLESVGHRALLISAGLAALAFALSLLFGVALVVWRDRLAAALFGDDEVSLNLDALALLRVGLILVGAAAVIGAVQMLLIEVPSLALNLGEGDRGYGSGWLGLLRMGLGGMVGQVGRLAVGASLVWWSAPLASLLLRGPAAMRQRVAQGLVCPSCGALYDPSEYREGGDARCAMCGEALAAPNQGIERAG
jgi:hypothetical protein